MSDDACKTTDWLARLAEVCAADGDEAEALNDAYDADWLAAYCAEFRRFAAERGWSQENIESGWLNETPRFALAHYARATDPAECARRAVPECEWEAANT